MRCYGFILAIACATAYLWGAQARAVEIEEGDQPSFEQLKTVLLNGSIRGREAAAERLTHLRTQEAQAVLFDGLADSVSAYLVADALEKSVQSKPEGMAALLRPGLSHRDYRTRMWTAYLLGLCPDPASSAPLAALLRDDNFNVRMYAAEALRRTAGPDAVPALIAALKDKYPLVRLHAAAALGPLKSPTAVPSLNAALDDPDAALNAATALGQIGGAEAETALVQRIQDPRPNVAWAALAALAAWGSAPATLAELKTLAAATADARTKRECEAAVQAIAGRAGK